MSLEIWMSAMLIVALALIIDRFVGEPPNAIHPLRWLGNMVYFFDRRIKDRSSRWTTMLGLLVQLLVYVLILGTSLGMLAIVRHQDWAVDISGTMVNVGEVTWIVLSALLFKFTFAIYSFRAHCDPIIQKLDDGDVDAAAERLSMIVSRSTKGMDSGHISSSCCETVSENFADSIVSPGLYFGFLGLFGAIVMRCTNMMDAMWGYLNERYGRLGFFPAKSDDVLGFIPSRISPFFILIGARVLRFNTNGVIDAALREHGKTPSPNSGWPMTATACALGISMEKRGVYVMGDGPLPTSDDVRRCCRLIEVSSLAFMILVAMPLFALIGIHLQMAFENWIYDILNVIL